MFVAILVYIRRRNGQGDIGEPCVSLGLTQLGSGLTQAAIHLRLNDGDLSLGCSRSWTGPTHFYLQATALGSCSKSLEFARGSLPWSVGRPSLLWPLHYSFLKTSMRRVLHVCSQDDVLFMWALNPGKTLCHFWNNLLVQCVSQILFQQRHRLLRWVS